MTAPKLDLSKVRVIWSPHPRMQTEFVNAGEFEVFAGGAKGPGKSDCAAPICARQIQYPRYKAYIIRETGPQLDELKARTHALYPQMPEKPAWNGDGHGRWRWPSGAQIIFESIATAADVAKIQGKEPSVIFHDEIANVADPNVIDLEQAELRSPDPRIKRWWRGTGNPGKSGHAWVKRRFIDSCGVDGRRIIVRRVTTPNGMQARLTRRFIPGTVLDNPIYANDALYMAQLATLPEVLRNQLLYGDWNAGFGSALSELDEHVHIVRPFTPPAYWTHFGSLDYGFAHYWVWIWYAADEDGRVFVVDTVRGRRHLPHEIAERTLSRIPLLAAHYAYTVSDPYPFQSSKMISPDAPTVADRLLEDHGIPMRLQRSDRKAGLLNLRYYLAWRGIGPGGRDGAPALRFMDTPGNRWLFRQLETIVVDPDDPEDALKVDADADSGEGGDDGYESLRNGMASRPPRAIGEFLRKGNVTAFSNETLAFMVETLYRDKPQLVPSHYGTTDLATYYQG